MNQRFQPRPTTLHEALSLGKDSALHLLAKDKLGPRGFVEIGDGGREVGLMFVPAAPAGKWRFVNSDTKQVFDISPHTVNSWRLLSGTPGSGTQLSLEDFFDRLER